MKTILSALTLFALFSCTNKGEGLMAPTQPPQIKNLFTASFTMPVSENTIRYEVTVWNTLDYGQLVNTVTPNHTGLQTFKFTFSVPHVDCVDSVKWEQPMFGSVKEIMQNNVQHDTYYCVTITRQ